MISQQKWGVGLVKNKKEKGLLEFSFSFLASPFHEVAAVKAPVTHFWGQCTQQNRAYCNFNDYVEGERRPEDKLSYVRGK